MISLALVADAIIGNVQEKAMRAFNASNEEVVSVIPVLQYLAVHLLKKPEDHGRSYCTIPNPPYTTQVLYSYSIGSVYIFVLLSVSGQLFSAVSFFAEVGQSIPLSKSNLFPCQFLLH
jgi:hypothetical protein